MFAEQRDARTDRCGRLLWFRCVNRTVLMSSPAEFSGEEAVPEDVCNELVQAACLAACRSMGEDLW